MLGQKDKRLLYKGLKLDYNTAMKYISAPLLHQRKRPYQRKLRLTFEGVTQLKLLLIQKCVV